MESIYRPCPVCRTQLRKRETPDQVKGAVPPWYAYECLNCGTTVWIQPFVNIKQVAKG